MPDVFDRTNTPNEARDQAVIDNVMNNMVKKEQESAIDKMFEEQIQPNAEKDKEIERLGYMKKKDVEQVVTHMLEKIAALEQRNESVNAKMLKLAARGQDMGKAVIEPEESPEMKKYKKMLETFPEAKNFLKPPNR